MHRQVAALREGIHIYTHEDHRAREPIHEYVCVYVVISSKLQCKKEIECNDEHEKMRILLEFLFLYLIED